MLVCNFFQGHGYLTFCSIMSWEVNPASLGGGSGGGGTEDPSGQGSGETPGYSELAQSILKDVPDEHKSLLEPYMKRWDAGTTRRFQDLSNKYKHYDSLGWDEETSQYMGAVYQALMEDPQRLYDALGSELGAGTQEQKVESAGETQQDFQGLPPEFQTQWDQTQQVLQALAQYVMDDQRTKQETVEDGEFDNYLGLLKQEYGEFDEGFVISRIANGMDGEAAVSEWNNLINSHMEKLNQSTQHLPNTVLSSAGGGAVSQGEQQSIADIPGKDIRQLIANVLSQTNAAGQ
jgi:hypothetical protein